MGGVRAEEGPRRLPDPPATLPPPRHGGGDLAASRIPSYGPTTEAWRKGPRRLLDPPATAPPPRHGGGDLAASRIPQLRPHHRGMEEGTSPPPGSPSYGPATEAWRRGPRRVPDLPATVPPPTHGGGDLAASRIPQLRSHHRRMEKGTSPPPGSPGYGPTTEAWRKGPRRLPDPPAMRDTRHNRPEACWRGRLARLSALPCLYLLNFDALRQRNSTTAPKYSRYKTNSVIAVELGNWPTYQGDCEIQNANTFNFELWPNLRLTFDLKLKFSFPSEFRALVPFRRDLSNAMSRQSSRLAAFISSGVRWMRYQTPPPPLDQWPTDQTTTTRGLSVPIVINIYP